MFVLRATPHRDRAVLALLSIDLNAILCYNQNKAGIITE